MNNIQFTIRRADELANEHDDQWLRDRLTEYYALCNTRKMTGSINAELRIDQYCRTKGWTP